MYCSTTAIQESVAFSSDTVTGLRLPASVAGSGRLRLQSSLLGPRPAGCKRQRSRRWEPQPGLVERSETERLYEGKPDREPLLDSTSPSALTRCHLPYRGEALAFRKAWPLRQRLPYYVSCLRSRLRGCMKARLPSRCSRDGEAIPSPALLPSATGSHPSAQHNKQTKTPPTVQKPSAAFCLFSQQRSMDQALASLLCSAFL